MRLALLLIALGFYGNCFAQDTCITTIKYGDNPDVGKFAKVNGITCIMKLTETLKISLYY